MVFYYYTTAMPNIKSAKKALRQSKKRRIQNLRKKRAYKQVLKQVKKLSSAGKIQEAKELIPQLYKLIDKAAKTNVIKKNKAGRLKSRTIKFVLKQKVAG